MTEDAIKVLDWMLSKAAQDSTTHHWRLRLVHLRLLDILQMTEEDARKEYEA